MVREAAFRPPRLPSLARVELLQVSLDLFPYPSSPRLPILPRNPAERRAVRAAVESRPSPGTLPSTVSLPTYRPTPVPEAWRDPPFPTFSNSLLRFISSDAQMKIFLLSFFSLIS